jgi:2-iminobutanoate/2-iminopropanoate deaminase
MDSIPPRSRHTWSTRALVAGPQGAVVSGSFLAWARVVMMDADLITCEGGSEVSEKVRFYPEYWGGKKLAYPNVPAESPKFARSVVAGNLIFVSGCQGQNDETVQLETDVFEEQMIIALDKVRHAMEEVGSSMNNVIKTLMLLKRLEDYPLMRKTELEYYQKYAPLLVEDPPASTFMRVDLAKPGFLVEIDVIGVVSRE